MESEGGEDITFNAFISPSFPEYDPMEYWGKNAGEPRGVRFEG